MVCKLCLSERNLIGKSHILPNFMYKDLFDDGHRMVKFTTQTPNSKRSIPTGDYESDILCADCDNKIIGQLESYASSIFYGGNLPVKIENFVKPDGLEFTQVKGVDYNKFKLFLLSLLWRASISKRDFFKNVNLGPYEEKIRRMIHKSDPGCSEAYPCIITSYRKHDLPKEIIAEPKKIRLDNNVGYAFLINGFLYNFKITENEKTPWILEASINESGEFKVLHSTEDMAKRLLGSYFGVDFP